jgi:hypothetical protein
MPHLLETLGLMGPAEQLPSPEYFVMPNSKFS